MTRFAPETLPYATMFEEYLDNDEHVLWTGQPRRGIFFRPADALLIPFSLFWGGFAIFWESMAVSSFSGGKQSAGLIGFIFPLWGIPFVLVGLYITVGRFFYDAWRRGNTWYAITDRRALIVCRGWGPTLRSFDLKTIGEVGYDRHQDGTGTLSFGPPVQYHYRGSTQSFSPPKNIFDHAPDATSAYRLVREVRNTGRNDPFSSLQ